ncbi:MAG: hypothetical protein PHY43_08330 [Verrucomicrobiales bacterium]|nr:hypothetical protein [Verrucomicrobiales bacterium]
MRATISAPLLYRVKTWQLIGLGFTGWVTLYSIALINWAACGRFIANTQGGCFAATMALAGLEARRLKKYKIKCEHDALHWADNIPTFQLNQTLEQIQQKNGFSTEVLHAQEAELGFGLRAVKDGRTFVFETSRWKEPTIDLLHAQATDENRKRAMADRAVIVSTGVPDEDTKLFVKSTPLHLLVGEELQSLIEAEISMPEESLTPDPESSV